MSAYNYKQASQQLNNHLNLNKSELLALKYGFEMVISDSAFNGRYFIKDGKKWIHNIGALKKQLGFSANYELEDADYHVEAYYLSH
jgi:hypothetical protein